MNKKTMLDFVKMLNEVSDAIDTEKVRFTTTEGTGEDKKVSVYYISKRVAEDKDGLQTWSFKARLWSVNGVRVSK